MASELRERPPFRRVRFVLPTNLPGSMTRITAETTTTLARWGIETTVLFPAVDWWEYQRFTIARITSPVRRGKWLMRLAGELAWHVPVRRRWCGYRYYQADSRVRTERFVLAPSAMTWTEDEVTVVHPPYLLPHILRTLPHRGIAVVSALHINLEQALESPSAETAAWYRHWVARDRLITVPRYTTSQASREAAERLGIPIRRVIYDGSVDHTLFRPAPDRPGNTPLVVTLYCDPNPQKGQASGVDAIRLVRRDHPHVRFHAIGRVLPAHAAAFDRNHGYLHREAFVRALQESDIFVYPSLYDGFPAPPLQAMACGAAVVTTAVEGVREYAEHEQNALVCAPGDVAMLAGHIRRVIEDGELRRRLQANGPVTARRFSVERSAAQLLEFLSEVYEEEHTGATVMVNT